MGVKVQGTDLYHRTATMGNRDVFRGDELGYKLTVLNGRRRFTGMIFATAGPTTESSGTIAVDKALNFIEGVVDTNKRLLIKNDQEASIQCFIEDLVEQRQPCRTIIE